MALPSTYLSAKMVLPLCNPPLATLNVVCVPYIYSTPFFNVDIKDINKHSTRRTVYSYFFSFFLTIFIPQHLHILFFFFFRNYNIDHDKLKVSKNMKVSWQPLFEKKKKNVHVSRWISPSIMYIMYFGDRSYGL